jgi:aspartokinase
VRNPQYRKAVEKSKTAEALVILRKIYDNYKMIELAESGAKVLHNKCVEMAKKFNVPIIVKSTFVEGNGTVVK